MRQETVRVLIVDDDPSFREGMRIALKHAERQLENIEIEQLIASDHAKALKLIKARPHLAFVDLDLPGDVPGYSFPGFHIVDQLREAGDTRTYVLSGHDMRQYGAEALQYGAVNFIPKSFVVSDANDVIQSVAIPLIVNNVLSQHRVAGPGAVYNALGTQYCIGNLVYIAGENSIKPAKGQAISLVASERIILSYFCMYPGRSLSHDIFDLIQMKLPDPNREKYNRTLDTCISKLRTTLSGHIQIDKNRETHEYVLITPVRVAREPQRSAVA